MKKTSKKVIAVTLSASMLLGGSMTAMAATTNPDISQREIDHKTAAKNIAAQGMVLMENKNNSLPISAKKGTKVALFGQGVYNTIKGGTGSGAVNQRDNVTVQQGFENAGYDIVNDLDEVLEEFDRVIGLKRLKAIHINDSLNERGSHKDRHARIGEGKIGFPAFERIVRHPHLQGLPFILETPNDEEGWAKEIEMLRRASQDQ